MHNSRHQAHTRALLALAAAPIAMVSSNVYAQQTQDEANSHSNSDQLEPIIVTAQRRSEAAQTVPIAISTLSGEMLQSASIKDLVGLTKGMIGIQYDGNSTQRPELYIRGIGTNRFDIGSDPSSGVFIDEVYQARFANVLTGLVDIDRVEVLRGPQGTLFGRNTIGGAISVTTSEPSEEFSGSATGSYGNKDYVSAGGTISGPLTEGVRARITANFSDRDGFMRDTVSGRDDGVRSYTVRGKLAFDLSEDTTLKITSSYFYSRQSALLLNPLNTPIYVSSPIAPQIIDSEKFSGAYTTPGGNLIRSLQNSARFDWNGDAATLTAIGSWIHFRQTPSQDLDGSALDSIDYAAQEKTNTYSGELRLSSTPGGMATFGDRLTWTTGVFLFQDKGYSLQAFTAGPDSIVAFIVANPTFTPPFTPGTISATTNDDIYSNLKSVAVYAQGTFDLTDRLGLTVGGRYTRDERDFRFIGTAPLPGLPFIPEPFNTPGTKVSSAFTPRIALDYKPAQDVLLYASWSRGFKSGAIQSTPLTALAAAFVTDPEKVDAYEIGIKSEFLGRRIRLNIAAFENKFKDLQVRRVVNFPNGFTSAVSDNAANSTIRGIEVEASALVVPGLRVNGSYAWLDAKYDQYVVDATTDLSGNRLPRAPRHRFNVDAVYTTTLANSAEIQLRAAYTYTGSFFFQPDNLAIEKETPYGLTDVSAQLTLPNQTTRIQFWGRNIFNIVYRNYLDPLGESRLAGYGERQTYGVTISQNF